MFRLVVDQVRHSIRFPCKVNSISVNAICDTGSSISVGSRSWIQPLLDSGAFQLDSSFRSSVRVANGSTLWIIGAGTVSVAVGDVHGTVLLYIAENVPWDILLGEDFNDEFRTTICHANFTIEAEGGIPVPFWNKESLEPRKRHFSGRKAIVPLANVMLKEWALLPHGSQRWLSLPVWSPYPAHAILQSY